MTLVDQIRELAIRQVNEAWWRAVHAPGAVDKLLTVAYVEDWDRNSRDARILLRAHEFLSKGWSIVDAPVVED